MTHIFKSQPQNDAETSVKFSNYIGESSMKFDQHTLASSVTHTSDAKKLKKKPKKLEALGLATQKNSHAEEKVHEILEPKSDAAKYTFDLNCSMCKIEVLVLFIILVLVNYV